MHRNQLAAAIAAIACSPAWAQTIPTTAADAPTVKLTGGISYGLGVRTSNPAPELLFVNNAGPAGLSTTNTAGRNQDDGNMNYRKGDVFTNVLTGFVDLGLAQGPFSALARVQGWYDRELASGGVPWGHSPNGFKEGAPLSDSAARPRGKFGNVIVSDLWVRNRFHAGEVPIDVTAGNQYIGWRGNGLLPGAVASIDPSDTMARNRPGVFAEETLIPLPAVRARLKAAHRCLVGAKA